MSIGGVATGGLAGGQSRIKSCRWPMRLFTAPRKKAEIAPSWQERPEHEESASPSLELSSHGLAKGITGFRTSSAQEFDRAARL